jgi:hypothetical protein
MELGNSIACYHLVFGKSAASLMQLSFSMALFARTTYPSLDAVRLWLWLRLQLVRTGSHKDVPQRASHKDLPGAAPAPHIGRLAARQAFSCCRVHMCRPRVPRCELGDDGTRHYPLTSPVCDRMWWGGGGEGTKQAQTPEMASAVPMEASRSARTNGALQGTAFSFSEINYVYVRCIPASAVCPFIGNLACPPSSSSKGFYLCPA